MEGKTPGGEDIWARVKEEVPRRNFEDANQYQFERVSQALASWL